MAVPDNAVRSAHFYQQLADCCVPVIALALNRLDYCNEVLVGL